MPVLRGLTFEVKPGQYVALVGASGCGKSTTVGLIERFYDPLVGDIVVDGLSVAGYSLAEYRKNISLVSQEPTYPPTPVRSATNSFFLDCIKERSVLTFSLAHYEMYPRKKWTKHAVMPMYV